MTSPKVHRGRIFNDRRATAIHEAGHAVIGRVMAQACGEVTINPDFDEGTAGYSITNDPWSTMHAWDAAGRYRDYRSIVIGRIITYQAGRHAEEEIRGYCQGGDAGDQREIAMMVDAIEHMNGIWFDRPDAFLARLARFSRMAVRRHEKAIRALAFELRKRNRMSEDDVSAFLQPHLPGWRWPPPSI